MADLIVIAVLLIVIGAAVIYMRKEKKKGVRCVGCPAAGECARRHSETACSGCGGECKSGCGSHSDEK